MTTTIIGDGPTALLTAMNLLKQKVPPSEIRIMGANPRTTTNAEMEKIGLSETVRMKNGALINNGPEFIDKEHTELVTLAQQLGVNLVHAADTQILNFRRPDGSLLKEEQFNEAYRPLAEKFEIDKKRAESDKNFARLMGKLPLDQYMATKIAELETEAEATKSTFRKTLEKLHLTSRKPAIDPDIVAMAKGAYECEVGQPVSKVSSLQWLQECGGTESLLDSDCWWRVEGGTAALFNAAKKYLEDQKVVFDDNAKLTEISKEGGKFNLSFEQHEPVTTDKVILAIPAYAIGQVKGMEHFGLSEQARSALAQTQYTNSVKFSVAVRDDAVNSLPRVNTMTEDGYQSWRPEPNVVTFLVGGDIMNQYKGSELVKHCLNSYAKSQGRKVDEIFDTSPGNIVYNAPGNKTPCYPTPAPGQMSELEGLKDVYAQMAAQGIGVAGNFIPYGNGMGFMENSAESAKKTVELMQQFEKHAQHETQLAHDLTPSNGFAARVTNSRSDGYQLGA